MGTVVDLRRRRSVAQHRPDAPHRRIENRGQRLQVAVGARGDELLGDKLMFDVADVDKPRRRIGELRPCSPRELPTRPHRPAHRLGDLVERQLEDVMQHEGDPLAGTQPSQHLQQRGANLVVESGPVGRLEVGRGNDIEGSGRRRSRSCRARADRIWSRQRRPATTVSQARTSSICLGIRARQPQERLLRDILGPADVTEHLVGQIHQVGAMTAPGGVDRR